MTYTDKHCQKKLQHTLQRAQQHALQHIFEPYHQHMSINFSICAQMEKIDSVRPTKKLSTEQSTLEHTLQHTLQRTLQHTLQCLQCALQHIFLPPILTVCQKKIVPDPRTDGLGWIEAKWSPYSLQMTLRAESELGAVSHVCIS